MSSFLTPSVLQHAGSPWLLAHSGKLADLTSRPPDSCVGPGAAASMAERSAAAAVWGFGAGAESQTPIRTPEGLRRNEL